MDVKKTSKEWFEEIPRKYELKILDPTGWNKENYEYSFNKKLITKNDFTIKLGKSLISCNHSFFTVNW